MKTCFPSENVARKVYKRKRRSHRRKRVFRAEMSLSKYIFAFARNLRSIMELLSKAKKRLPNGNAFPERKRDSERRKSLYRAKTSLPKAIALCRAKTSLAKGKTFLPSLNFDRKGENVLPSENNVCNGENASIERKLHNRAKFLHNRKCIY